MMLLTNINLTDILDFDWSWYYTTIAMDYAELILFGFAFFGIFANVFVIFAGSLIYKKTSEPTHLIISSITTADLLTCVMHQLRVIMNKFLQKPMSNAIAMQQTLTWISYSASGFSLSLLNMEKLMYFCWPMHYDVLITPNTCMGAIVTCWLVCLGYAVIMLISATNGCGVDYCVVPDATLYNLFIIFYCVIPVITSGVMSLCLFCTVRAKRMQQQQQFHQQSNSNNNNNNKTNKTTTFRQHLKCIGFIFSTTTWVVVSLVPARVHYIFIFDRTDDVAVWYGLVTNCFLSLSPMINPLITILVYKCYRNMAKKWLKQIFQKLRNFITDNSDASATLV